MFSQRFWTAAAIIELGSVGIFLIRAAVPSPNRVTYTCYNNDNRSFLAVDTPVATCKPDETLLTWNQTGPQGPSGPQGVQGPQGPMGPQGKARPPAGGHVYTNASPAVVQVPFTAVLTLPTGTYNIDANALLLNDEVSNQVVSCYTFYNTGNPRTSTGDRVAVTILPGRFLRLFCAF